MEAQKAKEKSCLKGYLAAKKRFKMLKQRSKSVLNCIWDQILTEIKQTAGKNCSVCCTDPLNVRLRAAEIRFGQLKEGKPPMLFILKKANSS